MTSSSSNKGEEKTGFQTTNSHRQAYFEAAAIGLLLGGLLMGFGLYLSGKLPPSWVILGSTLTASLTLVASSWSKFNEDFFQPFRKRWHFPYSLIIFIISCVSMVGIFFGITIGRADP